MIKPKVIKAGHGICVGPKFSRLNTTPTQRMTNILSILLVALLASVAQARICYQVLYNRDYAGNDIGSSVTVTSLADCMDRLAWQSDKKMAAYVASTNQCYIKNIQNDPNFSIMTRPNNNAYADYSDIGTYAMYGWDVAYTSTSSWMSGGWGGNMPNWMKPGDTTCSVIVYNMETTWCKQFAYNTNVRTIMRVRDDAVADGVNTFCANQGSAGSRQFSSV